MSGLPQGDWHRPPTPPPPHTHTKFPDPKDFQGPEASRVPLRTIEQSDPLNRRRLVLGQRADAIDALLPEELEVLRSCVAH